MLRPSLNRYNAVAVFLHWAIAVLIIFLLFPGHEWIKVGRGGDLIGWKPTGHASLGMLVLILSVFRVFWRFAKPPLPQKPMPKWQKIAAEISHGLFYVLMFALPLSGLLALQNFGVNRLNPEAVSFFRLFPLYGLPDLGHWTEEVHELASTATKALLALHVLAAVKHQFFKGPLNSFHR